MSELALLYYGVYEQNSGVNIVGADDWTTELAIIASNEFLKFVCVTKLLELCWEENFSGYFTSWW